MMSLVGPPITSGWVLLGAARPRRTIFGRLVLEVLEGRRHGYARADGYKALYDEWIEKRWRPATVYDMDRLDRVSVRDQSDLLPQATPRPWPHERRGTLWDSPHAAGSPLGAFTMPGKMTPAQRDAIAGAWKGVVAEAGISAIAQGQIIARPA